MFNNVTIATGDQKRGHKKFRELIQKVRVRIDLSICSVMEIYGNIDGFHQVACAKIHVRVYII